MKWRALACLLVLPSVSACSLVNAPIGPGYMWLHDANGTLLRTIEVDDQLLGSMCELSNFIGLTETQLVWVEGKELFRLDLSTGSTTTLDAPIGRHPVLMDAGLLRLSTSWDGHMANATWFLQRWDGGIVELDLPRSWAHLAWTDGQTLVVESRLSAKANVTTTIHDGASGALLAGPFAFHVEAGGADWLVRSDNGSFVLQREAIADLRLEGPFRHRAMVTEVGIWTQAAGNVTRTTWDGQATTFPVAGQLLEASRTHVVTGTYALAWTSRDESPVARSVVGALILVGAAMAPVFLRRR